MNNNKLLICVIIGIIVLFANGTPYSPSQVPQ